MFPLSKSANFLANGRAEQPFQIMLIHNNIVFSHSCQIENILYAVSVKSVHSKFTGFNFTSSIKNDSI